MADLTLTAANVQPSSLAVIISGLAAVAITAGQTVYEDTADLDAFSRPKFKLYDANLVTPAAILNGVRGVAANTAGINQPIDVVLSDPAFTHGLATVARGDVIVASATAGGLAPVADVVTGWRPAVVMIATSATVAVLGIVQNTTAK
jgi:hypothetical protein